MHALVDCVAAQSCAGVSRRGRGPTRQPVPSRFRPCWGCSSAKLRGLNPRSLAMRTSVVDSRQRPARLRALAGDGFGRNGPHWTGGGALSAWRPAGTHQESKLGRASSDREVGRGTAPTRWSPYFDPRLDALADVYALLEPAARDSYQPLEAAQ